MDMQIYGTAVRKKTGGFGDKPNGGWFLCGTRPAIQTMLFVRRLYFSGMGMTSFMLDGCKRNR